MEENSKAGMSNFKVAASITALISIVLLVFCAILGNNASFLLLNKDLGKPADAFFAAITHFGEVAPWVAGLVFVLICHRKSFYLLLACFIVSTVFVQGIKNILPEEPRPTKAIANIQIVHTVEGVELLKAHSFPSGHTSAAFTVFFFFCYLIKKRWVIPVGLAYALLVAYSRIYLAEHFPRDVAGGMLVAIASFYLGLIFCKEKKVV